MITIGFVIQLYGKEVVGEVETLARNVAERLVKEGFRVIVYATCARDCVTWRNEFTAGESILQGVLIRRFPVQQERQPDDFKRYFSHFSAAATVDRDEQKWLDALGPFCPTLVEALVSEQKTIDLFFFFSCLDISTVSGMLEIKKPLLLFPTIPEGPPLYLAAMREVFRRPQALFFLTQAEMEHARRLFSPPGLMRLVRSGIDIPADISEKNFRSKYLLVAPYLLYVGPLEKDKGLEAVFEYYRVLKAEAYVDLVLLGKKFMHIPDIQGLKCLGYVNETDKLAAFKGAILSLQPSPLASLSRTTMESFSVETPVLVNRRCLALLEHVESSGAGMAYDSQDEFLAGFRQLYRHPGLRRKMGEKGLEYVRKYYSWDAVLAEIRAGISEIMETKK